MNVFTNQYFVADDVGLLEDKLSSKERNNLPSSLFGLPDLRKFPLNDETHVRQAVIMFNHVDKGHEKELAKNVLKAMKKFGLNIKVSKDNRLYKYLGEGMNRIVIEAKEKKAMNKYTISFLIIDSSDRAKRYNMTVPAYSEKQLWAYIKKVYCKKGCLLRDTRVEFVEQGDVQNAE